MNRLAFDLEDPTHRTRDYLNALAAVLGADQIDRAAAQRVLADAIEASDESEAMRLAACLNKAAQPPQSTDQTTTAGQVMPTVMITIENAK